jgi:hypothetical protein
VAKRRPVVEVKRFFDEPTQTRMRIHTATARASVLARDIEPNGDPILMLDIGSWEGAVEVLVGSEKNPTTVYVGPNTTVIVQRFASGTTIIDNREIDPTVEER